MIPHFVLHANAATHLSDTGKLKIVIGIYVTHEDGTPVEFLTKKNFVILRIVDVSSLTIQVNGLSCTPMGIPGFYRLEASIKKWETELFALHAVKGNRQSMAIVFGNHHHQL